MFSTKQDRKGSGNIYTFCFCKGLTKTIELKHSEICIHNIDKCTSLYSKRARKKERKVEKKCTIRILLRLKSVCANDVTVTIFSTELRQTKVTCFTPTAENVISKLRTGEIYCAWPYESIMWAWSQIIQLCVIVYGLFRTAYHGMCLCGSISLRGNSELSSRVSSRDVCRCTFIYAWVASCDIFKGPGFIHWYIYTRLKDHMRRTHIHVHK